MIIVLVYDFVVGASLLSGDLLDVESISRPRILAILSSSVSNSMADLSISGM